MRKTLIILLLSNFFIAISCEKIPSQSNVSQSPTTVRTDTNNFIQENSQNQVGAKTNDKYKLTALFYRNKSENLPEFEGKEKFFDTLIIRNDATNQKIKLIEIFTDFSDQSQDVWSTNNEYILLPGRVCGQNGFCIYKSSEIVQMFEQNLDFQSKQPNDFISVVFTEVRNSQKGMKKVCTHTFKSWNGANSFTFTVRAIDSKDGFGEFEYDLSQQKIFNVLSKPSIANSGFDAINKEGRLAIATK